MRLFAPIKSQISTLFCLCLCFWLSGAQAQSAPPAGSTQTKPAASEQTAANKEAAGKEKDISEEPISTKHTIHVHGVTIDYTATVGKIALKSATGEKEADIFYTAYMVAPAPNSGPRPLVFLYNGGPGASSVYLHVGSVAPRRVKLQDEGWMPQPPFKMVDNEETLLDQADLVFVDPVGTGYSRPVKPELGRQYWGVRGDIASIAEFIRLFLNRYDRWNTPLFLMGESYGTFRSAGLSNALFDRGIALNGIILISSVLNMGNLIPDKGNELPYILNVPTYTAIAWYHKKLPADLMKDRAKTLAEAERWALTDYTIALQQGDRLTESQRKAVVAKLARYTGLSPQFVDQANLRISESEFRKELLREEKRNIGRYDGRFKGIEGPGLGRYAEFDPSDAATGPPFSEAFNQYMRTELNYKTDLDYHYLSYEVNGSWNWESGGFGYPETGDELRQAFAKNPYMKLFIGAGYYDLATPFVEARYWLSHLDLDPSLRSNVQMEMYDAGHMIYLPTSSRAKLHNDLVTFIHSALPKG